MSNLFIRETFVNETEGHRFGSSDWVETFTDDLFELFKSLRSEYGAPAKMYRDREGSSPIQVGWVFNKTAKYDDSKETYKQTTWIEVSKTEPIEKSTLTNVTNPFKQMKLTK